MEEVQMKKSLIAIPLILMGLLATPAWATMVNVDFNELGLDNIDLTVGRNPAGWVGYTMQDGITFLYDYSGEDPLAAWLSNTGIFGDTGPALQFDFGLTNPTGLANSLLVDYTLLNVPFDPSSPPDLVTDALFVMFDTGDFVSSNAAFVADSNGVGTATGQLSYQGPAFSQALLLFYSPPTSFFDVSAVSYSPVPEPGTLVLLASGILGMIGFGRYVKVR